MNLKLVCLQLFEDTQITELFDQLATYEILLDLLYDRKMYGDVLRINDEIRKRIASQNRYASSAINAIIFATYYRLVRVHIKSMYICICICITFTLSHSDFHAKLCKFILKHFSTKTKTCTHTNRIHRFMMNLLITCTKS